jgi:hypothetical protein
MPRSLRSPRASRSGAGRRRALVGEDGGLIAGHARILAARQVGIAEIPVMVAAGWSEAQKRAYVLADNQLAITGSGWDPELLRLELGELKLGGFDLSLTGFGDLELKDHRMYGSCFELCWSRRRHKREMVRVKWAGVFGVEKEPDRRRWHPTRKPVELVRWFIDRWCAPNSALRPRARGDRESKTVAGRQGRYRGRRISAK